MGKNGVCGQVLLVDDEARNRMTMRLPLEAAGHVVREAENGAEALARVEEEAPDVVLMDIKMPVLDGLEACRRLKGAPGKSHIPVLLVTGADDREHRLRGADAGADDFISKPPDLEELVLRVRNAVSSKRLYDLSQGQVRQLRLAIRQREDANRVRDDFLGTVRHELRTPLAILREAAGLLLDRIPGELTPDQERLVQTVIRNAERLSTMVDGLLDVSQVAAGTLALEKEETEMGALVREVASSLQRRAEERGLWLHVRTPGRPVPVSGDPARLVQALSVLIAQRIHATDEGGVDVELSAADDAVEVRVLDTGAPIPEEDRAHMFDRCVRAPVGTATESRSRLGLYVVRRLVEMHGGRVSVRSGAEGSEITVRLPVGGGAPIGRVEGERSTEGVV